MVRVEGDGGGACRLTRNGDGIGVKPHDAGPCAVRRRGKSAHERAMDHAMDQVMGGLMGEQHARTGIRQHEGEPLARVVRVERQISSSGLEDAEEPDDHVEGARKAQPHHRLRPNPQRAQVMRQPVGAPVKLAIGKRLVLEHDRNGIGVLCSLRRKQLRQGGRRNGMGGVVPAPQDGLAFLRTENVELAQRTFGRRNRPLQEANETARQRVYARALEQVGAIVEPQPQPLSRYRHQAERIVCCIMPADAREPQAAGVG